MYHHLCKSNHRNEDENCTRVGATNATRTRIHRAAWHVIEMLAANYSYLRASLIHHLMFVGRTTRVRSFTRLQKCFTAVAGEIKRKVKKIKSRRIIQRRAFLPRELDHRRTDRMWVSFEKLPCQRFSLSLFPPSTFLPL